MSTEHKVEAALLIDALRQYRHNNGEGVVFGYDREITERIVTGLAEDRDQQYSMKVRAREQRNEAAAMLRELASATLAIIAISDRKHDAWDAAKAVIAKVEGDHNQPAIGNGLQFLSAKDGKNWPTIGDKYLVRIIASLAAHNQQGGGA